MTNTENEVIDWRAIRLVVFDLDGTLYEQAPLRRIMALRLAIDAAASRSLRTMRVIRAFRRVREILGDEQTPGFLSAQYDETAARCGLSPELVKEITGEWMERRPLAYLNRLRTPGARALFERLKKTGICAGVWSDYPVTEKLKALDLEAEFTASAADPEINRLKPHPAGLRQLMLRANAKAGETIMIGDRLDRDGAAAAKIGCRYIHRMKAPPKTGLACRDFNAALFSAL